MEWERLFWKILACRLFLVLKYVSMDALKKSFFASTIYVIFILS